MFLFLYISIAVLISTLLFSYYEVKKLNNHSKKYLISERIIHWGSVFLLIGLIFTAIMNTSYYSKEDIMRTFEFSMPLVGVYDIDLSAQLFIARYERRIVWDHHFIMGVLLIALTIPRIILHIIRKNKSNYINIVFGTYIFILSILISTGFILHMGIWIDIDYDFRENCRTIHHYGYYAIMIWIVLHIVTIIYKTIKTKKDIIGNMIHGGSKGKVEANPLFSLDNNQIFKNLNNNLLNKGGRDDK